MRAPESEKAAFSVLKLFYLGYQETSRAVKGWGS